MKDVHSGVNEIEYLERANPGFKYGSRIVPYRPVYKGRAWEEQWHGDSELPVARQLNSGAPGCIIWASRSHR